MNENRYFYCTPINRPCAAHYSVFYALHLTLHNPKDVFNSKYNSLQKLFELLSEEEVFGYKEEFTFFPTVGKQFSLARKCVKARIYEELIRLKKEVTDHHIAYIRTHEKYLDNLAKDDEFGYGLEINFLQPGVLFDYCKIYLRNNVFLGKAYLRRILIQPSFDFDPDNLNIVLAFRYEGYNSSTADVVERFYAGEEVSTGKSPSLLNLVVGVNEHLDELYNEYNQLFRIE